MFAHGVRTCAQARTLSERGLWERNGGKAAISGSAGAWRGWGGALSRLHSSQRNTFMARAGADPRPRAKARALVRERTAHTPPASTHARTCKRPTHTSMRIVDTRSTHSNLLTHTLERSHSARPPARQAPAHAGTLANALLPTCTPTRPWSLRPAHAPSFARAEPPHNHPHKTRKAQAGVRATMRGLCQRVRACASQRVCASERATSGGARRKGLDASEWEGGGGGRGGGGGGSVGGGRGRGKGCGHNLSNGML
jgi:uncharacterized membrane protein YgcG